MYPAKRPPPGHGAPDPDGKDCAKPPPLRRLAHHLPHLIGLLLLAGAIFVVQREFRHLSFAQVRAGLTAIPRPALLLSAGFTLLAYFILSFYDRLAAIHVGHRLAFHRTFFASFCSYVLSHNLGFSALSGAAVRFRLYGNWGLAPAEIAQIIAFCSLTFVLGACALIGGVMLIEPGSLPILATHVPHLLLRAGGLLGWAVVAAYVLLSCRPRVLEIWKVRVELPGLRMAIGQVVVATLDVAATAAIAFALLPPTPGLGYPTFLAIYIASYTAGLVASVPGGLGVFDGAMLLGLSHWLPTPAILGMVFVFRIFYYIVPLFIAGILFAGHEVLLRGRGLVASRDAVPIGTTLSLRQSEADFSVIVAVGAVSLCGAMLLALGVLDPTSDLDAFIPPATGLFDHPSGFAWVTAMAGDYVPSLIGAGLMGMAIGLSNRVTLAWGTTIVLLCLAALLTFLRGTMLLVPGALLLTALLLAPFRRSYYRHARVLSEPFAPGTALPLLLLVGCVLTLGRLEPHLREIDANSWWAVVIGDDASNRTRLALGCAVLLMLLTLWRLILPGRIAVLPWDEALQERYADNDPGSPIPPEGAVASETGRAMIAFRRVDRQSPLLLGLGDPVGVASDRSSAIWRLRDLASQEGRDVAFWNVGPELLDVYSSLGLIAWPLAADGTAGRYLCSTAESGPALLIRLRGLQEAGRPTPSPRNDAAIA
ncbi:lysylphosphatidylglycerol synthase domain-containing protein [Lichenicoccus roseus]|uniref:Lysylphosphatidylglycerol synthetase family protein n=1 Tax=Lichenicoccus roseus TaxID=2683649 RepID=A0A5R9JDW7_9PROT|nr:lysylphosphatidylglycerol synthase domain-containing protein [Lichenicoccus roseus]TLU73821.1 lysylphosphatidylglycerol synthetase family protein [Lichenicoccus roseus]